MVSMYDVRSMTHAAAANAQAAEKDLARPEPDLVMPEMQAPQLITLVAVFGDDEPLANYENSWLGETLNWPVGEFDYTGKRVK